MPLPAPQIADGAGLHPINSPRYAPGAVFV